MTTGTKSEGSPSVAPYSYVRKQWTGEDWSPTNPRLSATSLEGYDSIRMWVYRGKQKIAITHRYTRTRLRARPPRRTQNEEHAYSCINQRGLSIPAHYMYDGAGFYADSLSGISGIPQYQPSQADIDNYKIALLGKLRERVGGSSFNAGVFLGEGKEALATIADSASRIYGAYHAVKRGNLNLAAQKLVGGTPREHLYSRKHAANNWLQLQYGWLPLLQDASDGAKFLSHHLNWPLQTVYRVRKDPINFTLEGAYPFSGNFNWTHCHGEFTSKLKAIVKEKNTIQLSGILDPLSVAWELTPYSFVADWFIPIGDYLSARGLSQALTGTFVTTDRYTWRIDKPKIRDGLIGNPNGFGYYPLGEAEKDFYEETQIVRSVSSTLQVPMPGFKPLGKVASWLHAANAVALLSNLFDKKR